MYPEHSWLYEEDNKANVKLTKDQTQKHIVIFFPRSSLNEMLTNLNPFVIFQVEYVSQ